MTLRDIDLGYIWGYEIEWRTIWFCRISKIIKILQSENNKVLGKFNDETNVDTIFEVGALRPKNV